MMTSNYKKRKRKQLTHGFIGIILLAILCLPLIILPEAFILLNIIRRSGRKK